MSAADVVVIWDAYAHAYSLTEPSAEYPEAGPDNLVRIAETYGVLVSDVTAEVWGNRPPFVPVYRFIGPRENVVRALQSEGWPDDVFDLPTA